MNGIVAIYCRLSEEDRNKRNKSDDSGSIQNQKMMLTEYAKKNDWTIFKVYSDDDYAGSDRTRPAFNELITDAKLRKFNIVLCKTQSRFTRELEIVEKYIHGLFPELGIRFVSIVDNIDTDVIGNKKSRQINGLINEWYLEDMSDSIKAALRTRMKAGFFIGSFAPYGYKKDPEKKGHLIIDEPAAEIVREIFSLYNRGFGRTAIARILNDRGIPSPEKYFFQNGTKKNLIGKNGKEVRLMMRDNKNGYSAWKVIEECADEIKKAYRTLAFKYHPDRFRFGQEAKIQPVAFRCAGPRPPKCP